jgi:hypothetical protein
METPVALWEESPWPALTVIRGKVATVATQPPIAPDTPSTHASDDMARQLLECARNRAGRRGTDQVAGD